MPNDGSVADTRTNLPGGFAMCIAMRRQARCKLGYVVLMLQQGVREVLRNLTYGGVVSDVDDEGRLAAEGERREHRVLREEDGGAAEGLEEALHDLLARVLAIERRLRVHQGVFLCGTPHLASASWPMRTQKIQDCSPEK